MYIVNKLKEDWLFILFAAAVIMYHLNLNLLINKDDWRQRPEWP